MIRIKTIHIEEFRGIRNLTLNLNGENFGIYGPNGAGKSGVVDAIEFCITGKITRLSGTGQRDVNIKNHAPHVDQSNNPSKAKVTITATIPSLGKEVKITRSVKNPHRFTIDSKDNEVERIVQGLQLHPEFALSRREIIKYIVNSPTKRSEDVQNLLRLDHIDSLRKAFTSYRNNYQRDFEESERTQNAVKSEFKNALGLTDLNREKVLEKINEKRAVLGLPPLAELTAKISFKEGTTRKEESDRKSTIAKDIALADIEKLIAAIQGGEPDSLRAHRESALANLRKLQENERSLLLARTHGFISTGLEFVTEGACPLCDTPWEMDELREYLRKKLLDSEEMGVLLANPREAVNAIKSELEKRVASVKRIIEYNVALEPSVPHVEINMYVGTLEDNKEALDKFLDDPAHVVAGAIFALQQKWWEVPVGVQKCFADILKGVQALPDSSITDQTITFLSVLQDRYERLSKVSKIVKKKKSRYDIAQKILAHYGTVSNRVLDDIYVAVSEEFIKFYKAINSDEDEFVSKLETKNRGIHLNVDFYGRGMFPPSAYHSDGHQDGMGLCLYLALMKHTLRDDFTFAVLDDVLVSVDREHRREVCRLLKTKFPNSS